MKYLKKFNENSYYKLIQIVDRQCVDIDTKVHNKLVNLIDTDVFSISNKYCVNYDEDGVETGELFIGTIIDVIGKTNTGYDIFQCEDEWFLVCEYPSVVTYKCDQIEGLLQLLKDKNVIKQ